MISLVKLIQELNKTNSSNEKQKILSNNIENNFISKVLQYTYDPLIQFGISSKNVIKNSKSKNYNDQEYKKYSDLFKLLDDLKDREITGHFALKSYFEYVTKQPKDQQDILYNIVDKNLKIRMGEKTINKVYGYGLIPVFEPVLAEKYNALKSKIDNNWYISRKLDGVRCLMYIADDDPKGFSRNGKDLFNLDEIIESVPNNTELDNYFLDGEVVYLPNGDLENDKEDFIKTIEAVRSSKSKVNTDNLFYAVFDLIPDSCFFNEQECPNVTYIERYNKMKKIFKDNKKILVLPQYQYTQDIFDKMVSEIDEKKWEGLMIRKNTVYKSGRTKDLLKFKQFFDKEFKVTDIITGKFRMISNKTGLEETVTTMTAVMVDNDGVMVKVGSGFSIDERKKIYKNPNLIIGKLITVKYFEETPDKSLRFPIYVTLRNYE